MRALIITADHGNDPTYTGTDHTREYDANIEVMNPNNNQKGRQKEQIESVRKQETDLDGIGILEILNLSDANVTRVGESMTDVTDKNEFVETKETGPMDKAGWIVRRISELGGYENVGDSVKADVFGFDITDVSGNIKLFSDVMKRLGINLDGDELYEEFQRIYDESVDRDACKEKAEDRSCKKEQDSVHFI
ncbi:hypothetical protein [Agathobacter sp.]|uniref:hypothetical protein n=1 Tax=Agathobacter sp. TaxID=2021311 RepID=UPI003AB7112A